MSTGGMMPSPMALGGVRACRRKVSQFSSIERRRSVARQSRPALKALVDFPVQVAFKHGRIGFE